jgi:hypothetical protein
VTSNIAKSINNPEVDSINISAKKPEKWINMKNSSIKMSAIKRNGNKNMVTSNNVAMAHCNQVKI